MTRTYQMMFDMINAGEFTPEEALAEAHELGKYSPLWDDAVELLVVWAWEKQAQFDRLLNEAKKHEVYTAEQMRNWARWETVKAERAAWAASGEEPF